MRVDEGEVGQAQGHRVDGEVASDQVLLEGVAEGHDRLAGRAVVGVGPVRGHLDDGAAPLGPDRAEVTAHVPRGAPPRLEHGLGLARPRGGREVEVEGVPAEEGVADRPSDEGQLVAGRREALPQVGEHRQHGGEPGDGLPQDGGGGLAVGHGAQA